MSSKKGNSGSFNDFLNALPSLNSGFSGGHSPEVTSSPHSDFDSNRGREERNPGVFRAAKPPSQPGFLGQVLDNPVLAFRASPNPQSLLSGEGLSDAVVLSSPNLGNQAGSSGGANLSSRPYNRHARFYHEFLDLPEDRITRGEEKEWSCLPIIDPYDSPADMLTEEDIAVPFVERYVYRYKDSKNKTRVNIALDFVKTLRSELGAGNICRYHWYGFFPKFVQFREADELERACSVPEEGSDWYPIYGAYIEIGLRFPIPAFLRTMLNWYGIALTQLVPNAVQEILAFTALCFMQSVQCTPELFEYFYELRGANKQEGFYQIHKRSDHPRLFKGSKTGHGDWKRNFFFMRSGSAKYPLNHRTTWARYISPAGKYKASKEVYEAHLRLIQNIPEDTSLDIMAITSPEMLIFADIYPYKMGIGSNFNIYSPLHFDLFLEKLLSSCFLSLFSGQRKELLRFSESFPRIGAGPPGSTQQGTGPLVSKAGNNLVPVRYSSVRVSAVDDGLPHSVGTKRRQGSFLQRQVPLNAEEQILRDEALAKQMAAEEERGPEQHADKVSTNPIQPKLPPRAPSKRKRSVRTAESSKAAEEAAPQASEDTSLTPPQERLERRTKQRQDPEAQSSDPPVLHSPTPPEVQSSNPQTSNSPTPSIPLQEDTAVEGVNSQSVEVEGSLAQRSGKGVMEASEGHTPAADTHEDHEPRDEGTSTAGQIPQEDDEVDEEDENEDADEDDEAAEGGRFISDPEMQAAVAKEWKEGGVNAYASIGLQFFHHFQRSVDVIKEYDNNLFPRLRKERKETKRELAKCKEALSHAQIAERVLKTSAEGDAKRIQKLEEENGEAQQLAEKLTKTLEDAQTINEALEEDTRHERNARREAEKKTEEALKRAVNAELAEKTCKLAFDNLQKEYTDVCASLEQRKKEAERFAKEKLDLCSNHLEAQKMLTEQLSSKDAEILDLQKQLLEARNAASSSDQLKTQVEEAVKKLSEEFEVQKPLLRVQGARAWRDTPDYEKAMEQNLLHTYALGWSDLRMKLHKDKSLDLNSLRINGLERMTKDGFTLFRKKNFSFPINLPDTPEELREQPVVEYEYKDSKLREDELPGLPEDYYTHLGLRHNKIKFAQVSQIPLDLSDPALYYNPADPSLLPPNPSAVVEGVPSTPASTSSSTPAASSESSDAGIFADAEVGEEIQTEEATEKTTTEDASAEVSRVNDSHPL